MALPQRQEYDLEGAAEYLGCSNDELALHLHRGEVRLGIITEGLDYDFAVLLKDLPPRVQKEITGVLADGEFADVLKPPTLDTAPNTSFKPKYLYLSRENRQLLLGSSNGQIVQEFQDLDGGQITIWLKAELDSVVMKRLHLTQDNEGWISHTTLTKEELDRFSGILPTKVERTDAALNPKPHMFNYPNLADEVARLMTDQMNQYIKENGVVASENILRDFIVERTYASYDHRDKQIEIGDEEDRPVYLSFKSFKRRYNNYFGQN